jgi:predicted nucleotidyltransferase
MTTLAQLAEERDRLLARVTQVLVADERITAAWLSGSYGRGETDEWSDLDLHVAVADEHLQTVLDEHQTLFAKVGRPLLSWGWGMRSFSMPNGQFWLVQYAPYMLEIDWSIGPTGGTTKPEASYVLFDRVGIATTPPQLPVDDETRRTEANKQLALFWAMAPIGIKFAGRGYTRKAVTQVTMLQEAYSILWRALWRPELLQKDTHHQNRPMEAELDARMPRHAPIIDPGGALAVILAFCHEVEQLHPALAELGVYVHEDVVKETYALAEVAETLARAGGSSPQRGSRR